MAINASRAITGAQLKKFAACGFVGIVVGFATVALYLLHEWLWGITTALVSYNRYFILFLTMAGLLGGYSILRVLTGRRLSGCGTHRLLEAYHYSGSMISERDTLGGTLASVVTIGLGGSAGLEGPSLLMGGGIASSIGRRLKLDPESMKIYLLSGAAAGLSAIFKAPLTGILFALEIPYQRDLAKQAFIPATFSSLIAYFVSVGMLGPQHIFPHIPGALVISPAALFHAFVLGVVASVVGRFFVFTYVRIGRAVAASSMNRFAYPIIGGAAIGLIGLYAPQVLGLGYGTIDSILSGEFDNMLPLFILGLLVLKVLATSITLRMGGTGGVFIPSIIVGALLGLLYSKVVFQTTDVIIVMAAMAALMAATNKTLLASIAFVAETVGPSSIIISLVSATTSYFASGRATFFGDVQPVKELNEKEKSVNLLYHMMDKRQGTIDAVKVSDIMTKDPVALSERATIMECLEKVKDYGYRVYPVVDEGRRVIGYVALEDLLSIPEDKWGMRIEQTLMRAPLLVRKDESLGELIMKMIERGADHAFVVDDYENNRLLGVVATVDVLKRLVGSAQSLAKENEEENEHEYEKEQE
ncbi:MAG: chloride channel protein [Candidatus Methanomethyliales bacterium]|nr:chloride channel protein [Candidatus Methanomethylicales archaeon]